MAKPWYRTRALRIFLDNSSLSVDTGLWPTLTRALDESRYLIVLLCPESAESAWVNREIEYWCEHKSPLTLMPVHTGGRIVWDEAENCFDSTSSTAIPPALVSVFASEPRHVDLTTDGDEDLVDDAGSPSRAFDLTNPWFRSAVAEIAAPLHDLSKDDIEGEDVRQHRRTRRVVQAVIAVLSVLAIATTTFAVLATANARRAEARRIDAEAARFEIESRASTSTQLAFLLAAESYRLRQTPQTERALRDAATAAPTLERLIDTHTSGIEDLVWWDDDLIAVDTTGRITRHSRTGELLGESAGVPAPLFLLADGRRLQVVTSLGVQELDPATLAPIGEPIVSAPGVSAAAGDGIGGVVIGFEDGTVLVEDEVSFRPLSGILAVAGGASGELVIAGTGSDGGATILFLDSVDRLRWATPIQGTPSAALVLADESVAVADAAGRVSILDGEGGEVLRQFAVSSGRISRLFEDGGRLGTVGSDSQLRFLDLETGFVAEDGFGHLARVAAASRHPAGHWATGGDDGTIAIEASLPRIPAGRRTALPGPAAAVVLPGAGDAVVILGDGRRAVVGDGAVSVSAEPVVSGTPTAAVDIGGDVVVGTLEGSLVRLRGEQVVAEAPVNGAHPVRRLAVGPDGRRLVSASDTAVELWDLSEGLNVERLLVLNRSVGGAFDPSGSRLAYDRGADLVVIGLDDSPDSPGEIVIDVDEAPRAFAFSPDGTTLATAGDVQIRFWSALTGEPLAGASLQFPQAATQLEFIDEDTLASIHANGAIQLWSIPDRAPLGGPALAAVGTQPRAAFTGGEGVVFVDDAPSLVSLSLDIDDLLDDGCELLGRSFAIDEVSRFDLERGRASPCEP